MLRLIDHRVSDLHESVALDAALLAATEENAAPETLRFWETERTAVIVGSSGAIAREVDERACFTDQVPVIRRASGGGAVVVGPGCLNYSLILSLDARPNLRDVQHSYQAILGPIVETMELPGLAVCGTSDLAVKGRKVSGSAQRRGRCALLHHGTFLYDFDIRSIARYLKQPEREPVYRAGRCHAAFVTNLPRGADQIKKALIRAWSVSSLSGQGVFK